MYEWPQAESCMLASSRISDLDGLYVIADANVALGSGSGIQTIRNEHVVVINLSSKRQGGRLDPSGEGVCLTLKDREVPVVRPCLGPLVPAWDRTGCAEERRKRYEQNRDTH